jgi:hypothetical protein
MAMSNEDHLKAALKMIQVTPENYKSLNANMILYLCQVVAEGEKLYEKVSSYEGQSVEQIKGRMLP